MTPYTFLIKRRDIRDTRLETSSPPSEIADGEVLLEIEKFALTANNVTYAATGDVLGYWRFFPSHDPETWGIAPCWGFATVAASKAGGIETGERLYGFLPMASHLIIRPTNVKPFRLTDEAEHRADLPKIYNDYVRIGGLPSWDAASEPHHALFQPLFATAFLLDDFFAEQDDFGAEAIILGSASSKTAMGLAHLLHRRDGAPAVVGLTSPGNADFVGGLGDYDETVAYDAIADMSADRRVAYIDMAGNTAVKRALHTRFGDNMVYSCAVGTSHWDQFDPAAGSKDLPGAKPAFFFAPTQAVKRSQEWGAADLDSRIATALNGWIATMDWLDIKTGEAVQDLPGLYADVADGRTAPTTGLIIQS